MKEYMLDCGCFLWVDSETLMPDIIYCPLHKAAPELYKALKEITELAPRDKLRLPYSKQVVEIADKALAKVEGGK